MEEKVFYEFNGGVLETIVSNGPRIDEEVSHRRLTNNLLFIYERKPTKKNNIPTEQLYHSSPCDILV